MDEKSNLNKIQADIFKFLESKGFLKELEQTCDFYQEKIETIKHQDALFPFCITLKLNFQEVKKGIRTVLTKEISLFLRLVEELVKNLANNIFANSGVETFIKTEQVHCNLRIIELPLQQFQFSLRAAHINRSLSSFRCIIFSTSSPAQYIRQSVWKCNNCFNSPLTIQRDHRDNHSAVKCFKCTSNCVEVLESRLLSDFCNAKVYEAEQIKNRKSYSVIKALEIVLFDDLCQELKVGQEYIVTGIFEIPRNYYNVFNITPI